METPVQFCYLKKIENLVSVPNPVLKIRPKSSLVFANWNQNLLFYPAKLGMDSTLVSTSVQDPEEVLTSQINDLRFPKK